MALQSVGKVTIHVLGSLECLCLGASAMVSITRLQSTDGFCCDARTVCDRCLCAGKWLTVTCSAEWRRLSRQGALVASTLLVFEILRFFSIKDAS